MREKITKRRIDALKPTPGEDMHLWDTEIKGLGLRVKPSGTKSFVLDYYAPNFHQKRRRMTLGLFGPLTVEDARRRAMELLSRVAQGEDPAAKGAEERRSNRDKTVAALFPIYLADSVDLRKASTLANYETLGRLYILPTLGTLPVARVSAKDVADLHRSMRSTKVNANRVLQLIKAFFYWMEKREIFQGENPASKVDRYPEKARERFLSPEELARLGDALRLAETMGLEPAPEHRKSPSKKRRRNSGMFDSGPQPANPVAVAVLRLLILSGWREQEALTLRWDAVDFSRGMVTLEATKAGRSVRALPAAALALIADQPKTEGSAYVFPGRVEGKPIREIQRLWHAVRHHAGLPGVRLHDLRHSVASFAAAQGHSLILIGKMLGHKDQRSTERYAHLADDARKAMADSVGAQIDRALKANVETSTTATKRASLRAVR